jgi:hypothetical protein
MEKVIAAKRGRGRPHLPAGQKKMLMRIYVPQAIYEVVAEQAKHQNKNKATVAAQLVADGLMAYAQS